MSEEATAIVRLGAGSFATVYVKQSRNCIAIKCVADADRSAELQEEFLLHKKVYFACHDLAGITVPCPISRHRSMRELDPDGDAGVPDRMAYTMGRAWPVSCKLAALIRSRYFPENERSSRRAFVARIYLGRQLQSSRISRFFNANNFPLDAVRCEELALPVATIAEDIGRALARIHHAAGLDARDIEFVLGANKTDFVDGYALYCFDFNQCSHHAGSASKLVDSFFVNDPYYPRPGMKYWDVFKDAYLQEAASITLAAAQLGEAMILEIEQRTAAKTAPIPPEGRGEEMV